jgi:hypothetical protein
LTGVETGLIAGLGLRSGILAATLTGAFISAFVSGLMILIADDLLGLTNAGDSSFGGTGEGVAGGCDW